MWKIFLLVRPERFELPTHRFVACCSIQLSYERTERENMEKFFVVRPERFELPTHRFVACCSIQLSYERIKQQSNLFPS